MSQDKKAEAFLIKWADENVGLVNRADDEEEAKRLVKACLEECFKQGFTGQELIKACANLSKGGKLHAYMLKHLEDFAFSDVLKAGGRA